MYNKEFLKRIENIMKDRCDFEDLCLTNCYRKVIFPLRENLGTRFDYNTGATKLVLMFEEYGFVLKIPFVGVDANDDDFMEAEDYDYDDWEVDIEPFCGADVENGWDYCQLEAELYEVAKRSGVATFFLETLKIFEINGFPIYIQPFMNGMLESDSDFNSESEINTTRKLVAEEHDLRMSANWATNVLNRFGYKKLVKLLDFLVDADISDLHGSNIGYMKNGKPIILDYSGYNH